MALWKDSLDNVHDDMGGTALALPNWPAGLILIAQAEADAILNPPSVMLVNAKTASTADINVKCEAVIVAGFNSAALGAVHFYTCTRDDQANLLALIAVGVGGSFTCIDGLGVKARRPHTAAQLNALLSDGQAHKEPRLDKARALKDQIAAIQPSATAVAEVNAIQWVFP